MRDDVVQRRAGRRLGVIVDHDLREGRRREAEVDVLQHQLFDVRELRLRERPPERGEDRAEIAHVVIDHGRHGRPDHLAAPGGPPRQAAHHGLLQNRYVRLDLRLPYYCHANRLPCRASHRGRARARSGTRELTTGESRMHAEPERLETSTQCSRRGHVESQSLTRVRMIEGELRRVQRQAMKAVSLAEEPVVFSLAVLHVTDDRT